MALVTGFGSARADDVVVKGTRSSSASRDSSVAGTVVRAEQFDAPGRTAADVLKGVAGVQVAEAGSFGSLATASVRGATSAQTPVYLAGVRLNDDVGGTADLSLVPLWMLKRIEVYRGNAPIQADRAGIGGAIFFDPIRASEVRPASGQTIGSFGYTASWARVGLGDHRSSAAVAVRREDTANDYLYPNDEGRSLTSGAARDVRRQNARVATTDAWVLGSTALGRSAEVHLIMNAVRREQGLPGLGILPTRSANATSNRELAGVTLAVPCGAERCKVTNTTSLLATSTINSDPLGEIGLGSARVAVRAARVDQSVSLQAALGRRWGTTWIARGASEYLRIDTSDSTGLRAERVTLGGGTLLEWNPIKFLIARAHASGTCDSTDADVPAAAQTMCALITPSLRLGAEAEVGSSVRLLANVGRYGRVPTLGERFGTSSALRGNTQLRPEYGVAADVGVRFVRRFVSLEAFGFIRHVDDLVAYVRAAPGYIVPYNVGTARLSGLEIETKYSPIPNIECSLAATALDARDISDRRATANDHLPFRSRFVMAPHVLVRTSGSVSSNIDEIRVGVGYKYSSSRYADAAGLMTIPAQGTLDIELSIVMMRKAIRWSARATNLLDARRFDLVGFPLPGRSVYSSTELRW